MPDTAIDAEIDNPPAVMPDVRVRLRVLGRYLRPQTRALVAAGVMSLVTAAFALAQPLLARSAVDTISAEGRLTSALVVPAVVLGAALVISAMFSGVQAYLLQRTGEAVVRATRTRMVDHLLRLPIAEFDRRRTGDLISRVGADTTLLRAVVTSGLVSAVSGVVTAVGALVLMAVVDPVLLLVTVVAVALVLFGSRFAISRIRTLSRQAQASVGDMTAGVERALGAVRTVRAARAESRESAAIGLSVTAAFNAGVRLARVEALLGPVASIAVQGAFLAVLGIGGARVAAGTAGVGDLVAFIVLLFLLIQPLGSAIQAATAIQTGLGAVERIEEVLAIPIEAEAGHAAGASGPEAVAVRNGSRPVPTGAAAVELRDVRFTYSDGTEVLRGVSFRAEAGGKTALVGPSGAGKSTILALVERFYDVTQGAVLVDGTDVRDITHDELRSRIAYVEQDSPALAGTIRDNLLLGAPDTAEPELLAALGAVNLLGIVERAPLGLDAPVGDDGVLLSGGERQRLAIARALVTRPALLLLDEPTANLDAANEAALQRAIEAIGERTSVLVIAHRLSTVVDAERIVVLRDGVVVDVGTHDELVVTSDVYRDLATRQLLV